MVKNRIEVDLNNHLSARFKYTARAFWKQRYLQAMGLPGVIWMFIFCYIPMYGILMAFTEYDLIRPVIQSPWVGLKYFKEFLGDDNFLPVMQNTFGISLLKLLFGFPTPIIFALLLNELTHLTFKRIVQTTSYLPHFLSWAVLGGMMMNWLSADGLFNDILIRTGIIDNSVYYLAEAKYFWWIAVGSDVWKEMGWGAIIYLAAISGIDIQLYESADMDGASRLEKIWYVTLPSISGTIAILFILSCGYLMNTNFDQIFVLTNQLNIARSNVIDLYVYRMGIQTGRFSYATAIGVFRSVTALILLLLASRISKKLTGQTLY